MKKVFTIVSHFLWGRGKPPPKPKDKINIDRQN